MSLDNPSRYSYFHGTSGDLILNFVMDNNNNMQSGTVHNVVNGEANTFTIIPEPGGRQFVLRSKPESYKLSPPKNKGGRAHLPGHGLHDDDHNRKLQQQAFSTIDIMVVWTTLAECELLQFDDENVACDGTISITNLNSIVLTEDSRQAMNLHVRLTVFQTNIAFMNSGVDARLNLVHAQRHPNYQENLSVDSTEMLEIALTDFQCPNTSGNGPCSNNAFAGISNTRQSTGADMVALLTKDAGGLANFDPDPGPDDVFSATGWLGAAGEFILAHELGHNFVRDYPQFFVIFPL